MNLVLISAMASKCQHFKHGGLQFYYIKWLKTGISTLKCWHFEAREDVMTKFRSQGLHIKRIKYGNASGSGFPPYLNPTLWNIDILHYKQAKLPRHLQHSVCTLCCKSKRSFACFYCKIPIFGKVGMREGGKSLPIAFQYLILMI